MGGVERCSWEGRVRGGAGGAGEGRVRRGAERAGEGRVGRAGAQGGRRAVGERGERLFQEHHRRSVCAGDETPGVN